MFSARWIKRPAASPAEKLPSFDGRAYFLRAQRWLRNSNGTLIENKQLVQKAGSKRWYALDFNRANHLIKATIAAGLVLTASPSVARPPERNSAAQPVLELVGGRWFDGHKFVESNWYSVGGRLTRHTPERVDVRVNLAGRYVLPPFAEAHNHDIQGGYLAAISASRYLRAGIFYSAQMCADNKSIRDFARLFSQPNTVDVLFATACVTASDGHPLGLLLNDYKNEGIEASVDEIRAKSGTFYIDSQTELESKWESIAATKTPIVKLILVNSEDYAANRNKSELLGKNGLDPALVPEFVRRAHAAGMRVAAHVDTASDFATAVAGGVDIIAHLPGYRFTTDKTAADYRISDAAIAEAARRNVVLITTAAAARHHMKRRPETAEALRATQVDNLRRLVAAGVRLALGSDLVGDGSVIDEFDYLVGLGVLSRARLLRIATMDTASILFPNRRIGKFAEGAEASLIAFDSNPLDNPSALRSVSLRIKQGNLLAPNSM